MKKYHLYLWLVALVGLTTACSRDEAAGPQNEASNRVRIGTSIDQALQTRAASVTIPADHKLRYVLEVWNTQTDAACIYRNEKLASTADAVAFDFTLSEAGDYKALLWADFVPESASTTQVTSPNEYTHYEDLHYKTNSDNGLKAVTLAKTGTAYVINDDARDAFFACIPINKGTGAFEKEVGLTRPFGQINVIEKNADLLAKVASMTLTYNVPEQFSVETGIPQGTAAVNPTVTTLPTATADRKANLFYDFIFTPTTAQTLVGSIKLTFTDNDQAINLEEFTIPANMPAVRNKRTNISGSILQTSIAPSDGAKLTVTVSDAWTEPDEEKEVVRAPKVGDFYYADGTWSSTYTSDASNPCIGIVFQTDPSRIGDKEKEALAAKGVAEPHGLVMALKNAATSVKWSTEQTDLSDLANCETKEQCNADISGLHNYTTVFTYATENNKPDAYPAFKAAKEYTVAAPEKTTGWYLPSAGQWYDIFANLGGLPGWESATTTNNNYYWTGLTELVSKINARFSSLSADSYDAFIPSGSYQYFWSSSEFSSEYARDWRMYSDGRVTCNLNNKSSDRVVRAVLAF